uniref:Uncharacterized protein n=1 Tax=Roseihalotalea indica TaxID=2867963 RepID=A0AA49JF35_9BACT|nr:hypothetical protein K4G66_08865 [Tunicatimonas sp. TK19036]
MTTTSSSQETIYYGGSSHRPPLVTRLGAGALSCQYEEGNLRYIRVGDIELVRMIYSAVRDHNWGTVTPQIVKEEIDQHEDHFSITYYCRYQQDAIDFTARYQIQGDADGSIRFVMEGEAMSTFQRNRIGFCVLHPASAAGAPCQIDTVNRDRKEGHFPTYIQPQQPFQDIQRMQWQPAEGVTALLEFEGDTFETEDQRNWTDDSFKTYCTPLSLPFPATVTKGEKIKQTVTLRLLQAPKNISATENPLTFSISEKALPLPAIGIGQSSEAEPTNQPIGISRLGGNRVILTHELTDRDIALLRAIGFSHYRVDLRLYEKDWLTRWQRALKEAEALDWPLELALHFSHNSAQELSAFTDTASGAPVKSLLIFHRDTKVSPAELLQQLVPDLRRLFPKAQVGSGTDYFFTELNRNRVATTDLDFLTYSINPQVHHFDNQSLIETLEAQAYTVNSTRQFAGSKSIHISPISLKMRKNPNATGPEPAATPHTLPASVDTRQMSLFGAGWTVGSLRNLIQSSVASLTYYETLGRKGIMQGDHEPLSPDMFPASQGMVYPMYFVFQFLLSQKGVQIRETSVSQPWQIEALVFQTQEGMCAMVANLQPEAITVQLPEAFFSSVKIFDENTFGQATMQAADFLRKDYQECTTELHLPPYALAFLRSN